MCGVSGILHWGKQPDAPALAKKQSESQIHRGPDDEGHWSNNEVAFSFRRLSIVDLRGGAQPMSDKKGEIRVVFNGEIYNHRFLRAELTTLGHVFQTDHSDTEVFVHGWRQWGEKLFERLNGMFAVAIWDERHKQMVLARDRYGIKPLYFAELPGQGVVFASEVRAIFATGLIEKRANPRHVREYLTFQNNWDGRTPFEGIAQVPTGTFWIYSQSGIKKKRYWDYSFPRRDRDALSTAAGEHREILMAAMGRQIEADVPVSAYLSGGIDSSAITAVAKQLRGSLQAYSCIFDLSGVGDDRLSDEREFSRGVADHLKIERHELMVAPDSLKTELDRTVNALEYPRMGMSYVNSMIARRVSQDAKVVLSGLGGDELHGGYLGRYQITPRSRPTIRQILRKIRHRQSFAVKDVFANYKLSLQSVIPGELQATAFTKTFLDATRGFSADDQMADMFKRVPSKDPWDVVMYIDATTYMSGLLVLEDKLSMAHSLETRVPLLDNELVDYVSNLDWRLLCDGDTGKIVFRESVKPWLPKIIVNKPKMGFGPPDASWYRNDLRAWIAQRLNSQRIREIGIFEVSFVEKVLAEHFSGQGNRVGLIWSLLSLDSWCRSNGFTVEHFA